MGTFDKVPLTEGKSYYNKQEGDWWQQANLPERLDDDYSERESTFMERQTPGRVKYTSAPGQYPPPSVRHGATVRMFGSLTSAPLPQMANTPL
jgi:hypothetical protein